ncbi:RtcB family protein [Candidatus Pacearchaeota archaeon]|nr:RtcB family protein [Candidatus Pacearchaeota archaeon]
MIYLIINKARVPIKIWASEIASNAIDQAVTLANNMPIPLHLWVAYMADAHLGKGTSIGSVLPLDNAIWPNGVGADIGCGMMLIKLDIENIETEDLKQIYKLIRKTIPVGNSNPRNKETVDWEEFDFIPNSKVLKEEVDRARFQLGTLGGGNHFIEVQKGDDNHIYWMVHSGSRNIGYRTAAYYHKMAVEHGIVPNGEKELAYFDIDSEWGKEYYSAMNWCLAFAHQNRIVMIQRIKEAMEQVIDFNILDCVNIHHNYACRYITEDGTVVMLHRKGATEATEGILGIIPGNQSDYSFLVRGKGNKESFESCSHGAGRMMGRNDAKRRLDKEVCLETIRNFGLEVDDRGFSIDETTEAYKPISQVMRDQPDLVDILVKLKPYKLLAIKG